MIITIPSTQIEGMNHSYVELDAVMTYCVLLKEEKAYGCCDYSHTSFILQEFDESNKRLRVIFINYYTANVVQVINHANVLIIAEK